MKRHFLFRDWVAMLIVALLSLAAVAENQEPPQQILITNVRIFDGTNETLMSGNVLVSDNLIARISAEAIDVANATVIDGGVNWCQTPQRTLSGIRCRC